MKILSSRRFALWWQLAMDWFQRQFAAIAASIDFTPVEEKVDEVKSDVADVKTAVENIDVKDAKEGYTHELMQTGNSYDNEVINRIVVSWFSGFKNYDLVGIVTNNNTTYYKWVTKDALPLEFIYTTKWKDLSRAGGDNFYTLENDEMVMNQKLTFLATHVHTATESGVKASVREVAGECIIPDYTETGLAAERESGFCAWDNDGDIVVEDLDVYGEHAPQYKVGDIIKPTSYTEESEEHTLAVAKTVTDEEPGYEQGLWVDNESTIHGVTEVIQWQSNHYYRVTGIHDVYNQYGTEVLLKIFTYEEVEPATITDMGKKIVEKLDGLDVHDENAQALAAFFNITPPVPNAVPMTQQEVEDDLDELWNLIITQ